jgi:hypothetical protein
MNLRWEQALADVRRRATAIIRRAELKPPLPPADELSVRLSCREATIAPALSRRRLKRKLGGPF